MPHKHKRKRGDESEFDLPPTQRARSLPVLSGKGQQPPRETKKKPKNRQKDNDAPRAFRRIMAAAQGKKLRPGLDDGNDKKVAVESTVSDIPRIRPGEDMRSFSARVDSALPVSGLTKKTVVKDGKDEQGIKVYRTRKERKMHKLYDQWRAEEQKVIEGKEEELEREAERELENDAAGITSSRTLDTDPSLRKRSKKGRKKVDDDPWLALKRKRAEPKASLHDVVKQPPELNRNISRPLTIHGALVDVDGIPKAAGSMKRREELQEARRDVLDAYRKMRERRQRRATSREE